MTEVYINNERIDLFDSPITQTFQLNDIADISSRQTSYTNSFKIPKTPKNVKVFNYLSIVGKENDNSIDSLNFPYGSPTAKIVEDGIELVKNGYATITETTKDLYNIIIYGAEKSIFEKLKEITLQDVFPNITIRFDIPTIDSFTNRDDDFIFSLCYYNNFTINKNTFYPNNSGGVTTPSTELYHLRMTPQFFVKDLFRYIFKHFNYQVVYPIINGKPLNENDIFRNLLISATKTVSSFNLSINDNFDLKKVAPNMKADVFLKEIMYRFNLTLKVDELNRKVEFKSNNDILKNREIVDWSDKFHEFKSDRYILGKYAQKNCFKIQGDEKQNVESSNGWGHSVGGDNELQGLFKINNKNLNVETTIVQSVFKKPKIYHDGALFSNSAIVYGVNYGNPNTETRYTHDTMNMNEASLRVHTTSNLGITTTIITDSVVAELGPQLFLRKKVTCDYKFRYRYIGSYVGTSAHVLYQEITKREISILKYIDKYSVAYGHSYMNPANKVVNNDMMSWQYYYESRK